MLPSPAEAFAEIRSHLRSNPTEDCPLAAAHGRVLRQPIVADRPMPPFHRITMDGFAVRAADWGDQPPTKLKITAFQAAGMRAKTLASANEAIEVATGAVLPEGADTVVPYEETSREDDEVTLSDPSAITVGQNIHRAGSDFAAGACLIPAGTRLTGREIAVAATVGTANLRVAARPAIALIATGDELVEVDVPHIAPHQIRKSNDYALQAALHQSALASRIERFHLRDHRAEIDAALKKILSEFDVVVITGGVSKGKLDHLPRALADLGVTQHLRGVAQRPGKPLWFGTTSRQTPVFALPGNPVSTYTCLHRYVLPSLRTMAGEPVPDPEPVVLAHTFRFERPLSFLLPVQIRPTADGGRLAHPAPFNTSGDLGGLLRTDGFVELPADQTEFPAGTVASLWRWT